MRAVSGLGVLLILTSGSLVYYRVPVAQYLIDHAALQAKIPNFQIRVSEISLDEIIVEELVAGTAEEFSSDKVQLNFDIIDLWQGGILEVNIDGLVLALDVTGAKPLLGSLDVLFGEGGGDATGPMPTLPFQPELHLTNSALNIMAEPGVIHLPLAAEVIGSSEDNLQGWVSFDGGTLGEREPEEFYLGLIFSPSDLQFDWDIDWMEIGIKGGGSASFFLDDPGLSWNVYGDVAGNLPVGFIRNSVPEIKNVSGEIKLDGTGSIKVSGPMPDRWRTAIGPILKGLKTATVNLSVETQTKIGLAGGMLIEGDVPLKIQQHGKETLLKLTRNATYSVVNLGSDRSLLPEIGNLLGEEVTGELLKDGTDFSLSLDGERPYSGKLSGKVKGQTEADLEYVGEASGNLAEDFTAIEKIQGKLSLLAKNVVLPEIKVSKARISASTSHEANEGWEGDWSTNLEGAEFPSLIARGKGHLKVSDATLGANYHLIENTLALDKGHGSIIISSLRIPKKIKTSNAVAIDVKGFESSLNLSSSHDSSPVLQNVTARAEVKALKGELVAEDQTISLSTIGVIITGEVDGNWRLKSTIEALLRFVE